MTLLVRQELWGPQPTDGHGGLFREEGGELGATLSRPGGQGGVSDHVTQGERDGDAPWESAGRDTIACPPCPRPPAATPEEAWETHPSPWQQLPRLE